jgi:hypothetical protein
MERHVKWTGGKGLECRVLVARREWQKLAGKVSEDMKKILKCAGKE